MPIIGTAGHVDHGKSTLVHSITGRDPDRWAEEKERGLTIDLGFAWAEIKGLDVGFVDVPGHERFIKNMLAGVGAIDCALLVIAADSGWMPQTEEHATVLDLLNTTNGVIALTRIDLVDEDTTELATLEIMDEVEGTTLEGWPIVPVSAVTGQGLEDLIDHLGAALISTEEPQEGPLMMWVDRAFTVSGAGVVATGTISSGRISEGDEVEVLPSGYIDRVRGLHHHDSVVNVATAGSRTAVNLQNTKAGSLSRGSLLCEPGSIGISNRVLAKLVTARSYEEIPQRGSFHLHIGTAHSPVTVRRIHRTDAYLISLDDALPLRMGDRFILRDSGRQAVVGGGQILDPQPRNRVTTTQVKLLLDVMTGSTTEMANALLINRGIADSADISRATRGGAPSVGIIAGKRVISDDTLSDILERSERIVSVFHEEHPLRPGIIKPELATRLGVDPEIIDAVVAGSELLLQSEGAVRLARFRNSLTPDHEREWMKVKSDLEDSFDVPSISAIGLEDELLHALIRRGDLIQISPDLAFTNSQVETIHKEVLILKESFTVGDFRDHFKMTRRQAIPTLEWLDRTGVTKRTGDVRTIRKRR